MNEIIAVKVLYAFITFVCFIQGKRDIINLANYIHVIIYSLLHLNIFNFNFI